MDARRALPAIEDKLVVRTAIEPFSLYLQVSLYAAVLPLRPLPSVAGLGLRLAGPLPARARLRDPLPHRVASLSSRRGLRLLRIFPRPSTYLLGLGQDFRLFLNATDYFDFIILIMLGDGRGLPDARDNLRPLAHRAGRRAASCFAHWRISLIVILAAAAVLSPTSDVPNMMLFAAPMIVLYLLSILIAWIFARPRTAE